MTASDRDELIREPGAGRGWGGCARWYEFPGLGHRFASSARRASCSVVCISLAISQ